MQDLNFLIHALTPNEKRYVSVYITRFNSGKNNYALLFDFISKNNFCTDELIIKKYRKEKFVNQLTVTKHYLFKIILNAMRAYYQENFIEWKLRNQLDHIFVLTSKSLDKLAHKLIQSTKKEAWTYEYYFILLEIINHERWLFGNRRINTKNSNFGVELCNEENKIIDYLTKINLFKKKWHQLTEVELNKNKYDNNIYITKLSKIISDIKIIEVLKSDSFTILSWYYVVWAHYYMLISDDYNHYLNYKEVVIIREKQASVQPNAAIDLYAIYYNFMIACYKNKSWEELELYLSKISKLDKLSIEKKIKFFHDYYHCTLLLYLGTKQYENAYKIIPEIYSSLNIYDDKIRLDFKILLWQCCGLICFFMHKYKEASQWWLKILHIEKTNIEIKIQCSVQLYMLILSVEDGNIDILSYQIKQTIKFIKSAHFYNDVEIAFINLFKMISRDGILSMNKSIWKSQYEQMSSFTQENKNTLIDEHILCWLEMKSN
jgi:hypothetical protein